MPQSVGVPVKLTESSVTANCAAVAEPKNAPICVLAAAVLSTVPA